MALKPTILLAVLCAALAARNAPSLRLNFRSGYSYSFNYNGQVISSLSNGEDFSGIRLRSEVSVEFLDENTALVKLLRPELGKLNGFLDSQDRIHPFQKFEPLDVKPEHGGQLVLPFEIQYDNGKVSEIKFHREDSVWSENIKRSIVNLLEVQLENPSETAHLYPSSYVYQTNETTIEGECESTYHIQKIEDSNDESVEMNKPMVNITKTINFEKCRQRPELRYNFYRHTEPVDWSLNKQQKNDQRKNSIQPVVDSISQYEFNIQDDIIRSAKVLSKYSYDLVDKDHVSLITSIIGQMELKNSERRRSVDNDFAKKSPQSLIHSNELDLMRERFITQGNEEYIKQNPYLRLDNAVDVVKNILRRLVKSSIEKEGPEGIEEEATNQFSHLVTMLRLCSKNDIQQIHENFFKNTEYNEKTQQFVKEILADALAVAGTKNTIDHLVEKIERKEISPSKASRTLENLYKLRLTSEQMVKPIWKLCDSEISRNNENLKRSCYLAWGAMVNAMCGHSHEHDQDHENWALFSTKEKICLTSLKQQFIQDVMRFYQQSSLKSDKILALKTLGNMGIDESVDQLEKVITDRSEDRLVRINAIDALRNLRDQVPQKVQRLLTLIFHDRREHPEIRMNAFHEILQTRPDSALLHLLCAEMAHETNVDVKSFVVSSIQQLAENSDRILDKETSNTVKSCLVMLEQMDETFARQSASKKHQTGYFSNPSNWHELGGLLTFASIFSNDSYLPKELMTSLDLLVAGRLNPNTWQFGVHMQELEQLTNRMAQNFENKGFDDIVIRGRRSLVSDYNPIEMLKSLFNKVSLVARRRSATDAEPMFLFYNRVNNLDYSFYILDESNLPNIFKKLILEGRLDVSLLEENNGMIRTNGAWYNFESQLKLPTTIGIPMIITSRMTTIGFIDGKYSSTFGSSDKVRNANFDLDVHPQAASSVVIKMEVFSPLFTSGVKTVHSMQGRLPLNMKVEIKSPNLIPTISWRIPERETRLVHFQSRPVIFVRVWPQKSNVFIEATEKTLLIPELDHLYVTKDFEVTSPLTGTRFVVQSHGYRRPLSDYDWILSGENALEIRFKPTQGSAKTVRFSGQRLTLRDSQAQQKLENIFAQQPALSQNQDEIQKLQESIRRSSSRITDLQKISLKVETVDSANDKSITMDIKTACDDRMSMCVFDKDIKVDFGNVWTWKTIGQIALPELHGVYAPIKSGHVVGKIESSWGSRDKNTVIMNVYGKPSELQINQFKTLLNKNVDVSDKYDRDELLDEKLEKLPSKLKPNEYTIAIEHQVTEDTLETIVPWYNWIKTCPKVNLNMPDSSKVDSAIARRHSTLLAQLTYNNYLNLTLTTPEEQLEMVHWDSNEKRSNKQKTIVDMFASSHDDYSKCTYKREQIETFDGQTIDIPLTTCYTILAKDCGDSKDSEFAVIAKKMSKEKNDLQVQFITKKTAFELYNDQETNKMVIKANNQILTKSELDRYNIRKIESSGMTFYEVKPREVGVIVRFDGQKIVIKISDEYVNRQCGICGHMNNDRDDDFLKSDNTQAESVADFHLSYMNRYADECDPLVVQQLESDSRPNEPNSRRRPDVVRSDEQENKMRSPIKKTMIEETRNEICFSLKPVKTCPADFYNEETEEIQREDVGFKCFQRSSPEAQRYSREARKDNIDFDGQTADETKSIVTPTRCVKY